MDTSPSRASRTSMALRPPSRRRRTDRPLGRLRHSPSPALGGAPIDLLRLPDATTRHRTLQPPRSSTGSCGRASLLRCERTRAPALPPQSNFTKTNLWIRPTSSRPEQLRQDRTDPPPEFTDVLSGCVNLSWPRCSSLKWPHLVVGRSGSGCGGVGGAVAGAGVEGPEAEHVGEPADRGVG